MKYITAWVGPAAETLLNTVPCDDAIERRKTQSGSATWSCCCLQFAALLAGHAAPPASGGGEAGGDKATDAATQDGNKTMLVMSGGEGYIDFRMGEFEAQFSL